MEYIKENYTEISAGGTYPTYIDYRLATELGFKFTYTFCASGKLFGAMLHLPSGWVAKSDFSNPSTYKAYSIYDENKSERGFIVYLNCEVDKDSHIIKNEAFLDVTLFPRFEICLVSYHSNYRLKLTDHKGNVVYYTTQYYSSIEKCTKKCIEQKELLKSFLPRLYDLTAYWDYEDDLLQVFFAESNYYWIKVE